MAQGIQEQKVGEDRGVEFLRVLVAKPSGAKLVAAKAARLPPTNQRLQRSQLKVRFRVVLIFLQSDNSALGRVRCIFLLFRFKAICAMITYQHEAHTSPSPDNALLRARSSFLHRPDASRC